MTGWRPKSGREPHWAEQRLIWLAQVCDDSALTDMQLRLAFTLARAVVSDRVAASYSELADEVGAHPLTVRTGIKALERRGHIEAERQGRSRTKATIYRLVTKRGSRWDIASSAARAAIADHVRPSTPATALHVRAGIGTSLAGVSQRIGVEELRQRQVDAERRRLTAGMSKARRAAFLEAELRERKRREREGQS
ncbi:MAG TPA: hypothetical protein VGF29_04995 [Hyphomicrobiaceae bacterium]|jgi:predicted ArsR family transcriptional regulator